MNNQNNLRPVVTDSNDHLENSKGEQMKAEVLLMNGTEVEFKVEGNKTYISSLEIARTFGKRHDRLLQTIRENEVYGEFLGLHKIVESSYINSQGKNQPMYLLDRDAFSFFVMGFTVF